MIDLFLILLPMIISVIVLIYGLLLLRFPAKKINFAYGYVTPASMRSQHNWDFSQVYAGKLLTMCGALMTLISFVLLAINPNAVYPPKHILTLIFFILLFIFLRTESAIKKSNQSNE